MDDDLLRDLLGEDELGIIIRAHIHIEEYVDKFLILKTEEYKYLEKVKLEFSEKVLVGLSLGLDEKFYSPLIVISKIRNKFAHKTDSSLTQSDVNNLYESFCAEDKADLQKIIRDNPDRPATLSSTFKELTIIEKLIVMVIFLTSKFAHIINDEVCELQDKIKKIDNEKNN
jgi:hypothetical protein